MHQKGKLIPFSDRFRCRYLGDLSPKQEQVLADLKAHIRKSGLQTNNWYHDVQLLRFCRARQFKIEKVVEMLENNLKFREEQQADTLLEWYDWEMDEAMLTEYQHGFFGVDKIGRPLYIDKGGYVNIQRFLKSAGDDINNIKKKIIK